MILSLHSRIELNWIALSVAPLFCLMVVYWRARWHRNQTLLNRVLAISIGVGAFFVITLHDTNLLTKIIHRNLPPKFDLLHRVRGWKQLAQIVGEARQELEAKGQKIFVIGEHYGFTSQITFYLPEAKTHATNDPFVFCVASPQPQNQFYFWPGYENRLGQTALYVR